MSKLGSVKLGLGEIQQFIVEYLEASGGATSKLDLEAFAALFSIKRRCINRSALRLVERGMVRYAGLGHIMGWPVLRPLSKREMAAVLDAQQRHRGANAFWVLTDAAMNIIGEEPE